MGRIRKYFLRAGSECGHLHLHSVAPIGGDTHGVTAVYIRPCVDLFLGGGIHCRNSGAWNRHIPGFHYTVDGSRWGRRCGILCPQPMRMKHNNVKQEQELEEEFRAQLLLECCKTQKARTRTPHSVAQTLGAVSFG